MKTIVLLSGGMDSAVLAYHLVSEGQQIKAISYSYGQKHLRELECAKSIASALKIEHRIADLTGLKDFFGKSALTDQNISIPHGHYAEDTMKSTIVPNRNMIFLSIAAAWAVSSDFDSIAFAAHAGDHFIYPDCRSPFIESMDKTLKLANNENISLTSPFAALDKAEICAKGALLKVPFKNTWSCYEGEDLHCGKCGTCVERKEAFLKAEVLDPTEYKA